MKMKILMALSMAMMLVACNDEANQVKSSKKSTPSKETAQVEKKAKEDRKFAEELNQKARKEYDELSIIISPDKFNANNASTNFKNGTEVMEKFLASVNAKRGKIKITEEDLGDGLIEVTCMNYDVPGNAPKTEKIIMLIAKDGKRYDVNEIRKNWRCGKANSKDEFSVTPCR